VDVEDKMKNNKVVLIIFGIMLILTGFVSADLNDGWCGVDGGGNYGLGMGLFGWIFSVLILITLVLFIFWLIKQIQKPNKK